MKKIIDEASFPTSIIYLLPWYINSITLFFIPWPLLTSSTFISTQTFSQHLQLHHICSKFQLGKKTTQTPDKQTHYLDFWSVSMGKKLQCTLKLFFPLFLLTCPQLCKSLLSSCLYSANHTNFKSWRSQVLVHTSHRHVTLSILTHLVVYTLVFCNVYN